MLLFALGCGGDDEQVTGGKAAVLTATPTQIQFANVAIDQETEEPLTISNTGEGLLRIESIDIVAAATGSVAAFHTGQWVNSAELKPGESIDLTVFYRPTAQTRYRGHVELRSNDPNNPVTRVGLSSPDLAPELYTPESVVFHRVPAGAEDWQIAQVQNIGFAPLLIDDIVITGSDDFTISFPDGGERPASLAPDDSFALRVDFAPADDDPSNAEVIFYTNDPTRPEYRVTLIGNAGAPCISMVDESGIEFSQAAIGAGTNRTVLIENCSRTSDLVVSEITITDDGDGVYEIRPQSYPGGLPDSPLVIPARESAAFILTFSPIDETVTTGEITIRSNDPLKGVVRVPITGVGNDNACPTARAEARLAGSDAYRNEIFTRPLENIVFSGLGSEDPDGEIARYEWTIITRPDGSTQRLTPNGTVAEPRLWLDLAGTYEVELVVYDDMGMSSCESSIVTIHAVPGDEIHVQLVWTPPGGNTSDMDLHYMHPLGEWGKAPYTVYFANRNPQWGTEANPSNPRLDLDDLWGNAPENINHENPVAGLTYAVGVHHWGGPPAGTLCTVRIYVMGQLGLEMRDQLLTTGEFWHVGFVQWPSGNIIVRDVVTSTYPDRL